MTIPPELSRLFPPQPPGQPPGQPSAHATGTLLSAPASAAADALRSAGRFAAVASAATLAAVLLLMSIGGMGGRVVASDAGQKRAWMVALAVVGLVSVTHALLVYAGLVAAYGRGRYARMAIVGGDHSTILKAMALDARRLRVMSGIAFGLALIAVVTASVESDAWSWMAMLRPLLFEAQRQTGARLVSALLWLSMLGSAWAAWVAAGASAEVAAAAGRDGAAGFEVVVAPVAAEPVAAAVAAAVAAPAGSPAPPPPPRPARPATGMLAATGPADPWRAVLGVLLVAILGIYASQLWRSYALARVMTDDKDRPQLIDSLTLTKASQDRGSSWYPGKPEPERDPAAVVGATASLGGHVVLLVFQAWLVVWAATCVFAGPRLWRLSVLLAWAMFVAVVWIAIGSAVLSTRPGVRAIGDWRELFAYDFGSYISHPAQSLYLMATERLETRTAARALLPAAVLLVLTRWPVRAMFEQAGGRRG